MNTAALLLLSILLAYAALVIACRIGWMKLPKETPPPATPSTRVSILIPSRDEESNLPILADLLGKQDYPSNLLEIIWIDDHSTDGSMAFLEKWAAGHPNRKAIANQGTGKKAALRTGAAAASGELLLLTDADSRPGSGWVASMVGCHENTGASLILGPVALGPANGVFDRLQQLEFLSMVAVTAGTAGLGRPILAQGPNLAVRAADYRLAAEGLAPGYTSGDDVFLVQEMRRHANRKIVYLVDYKALVTTPPASPAGFWNQRLRWASKAGGYRSPLLVITTLLVFLSGMAIISAAAGSLAGWLPAAFPIILLAIKLLTDLPLVLPVTKFFRLPRLMAWFLPASLIHPFYVTFAGIASQLAPLYWKGRKVKRET